MLCRKNKKQTSVSQSVSRMRSVAATNPVNPPFLVLSSHVIHSRVPLQDTEDEEEEEQQRESPGRRSSIQESLALPVISCCPGDAAGEAEDAFKASSSPSLSPSVADSVESGGSLLSSPKEASSAHSPTGFTRSVKKRESKGKGKEAKGLQGLQWESSR